MDNRSTTLELFGPVNRETSLIFFSHLRSVIYHFILPGGLRLRMGLQYISMCGPKGHGFLAERKKTFSRLSLDNYWMRLSMIS